MAFYCLKKFFHEKLPYQQIESILTHVVLNPAHVPHYWTDSPTLGTLYSPRKRRADIEVPNQAVDSFSRA